MTEWEKEIGDGDSTSSFESKPIGVNKLQPLSSSSISNSKLKTHTKKQSSTVNTTSSSKQKYYGNDYNIAHNL